MPMYNTIAFAGLIPVGFQTMTLANSTAIAVNSTCRGGNVLHISVESSNVRYRSDATAPTMTTGVLVSSGVLFVFEGYNGTANLKFQRSTGTARVQIMSFKNVNVR